MVALCLHAGAQHEFYWDDIVGNCNSLPDPIPLTWPGLAPTYATWSDPNQLDPNNSNKVIVKSFEIPAGKTLEITSGVFEFLSQSYNSAPGSKVRIHVRRGGQLIIDGATLTRCGSGFWDGIEVDGDISQPQGLAHQGKVIIRNGATIEYAYETLKMGYGGILEASNSTIKNFKRAAEFLKNDYPSASWFRKMNIEVDDNYPIRNDNDCSSLSGKLNSTMVTIWSNNGIRFMNCNFRNKHTSFQADKVDMVGGGIGVLDADVEIDAVNPNFSGDCLVGTGKGCWFENLAFGIEARKTQGFPDVITLDVRADIGVFTSPKGTGGNDYHFFDNCAVGIIVQDLDQAKITGSYFEFTDKFDQWGGATQGASEWCEHYALTTPAETSNKHRVGVFIEGTPRYIIGENRFVHSVNMLGDAFTGVLALNNLAITPSTSPEITWDRALIFENEFIVNAQNDNLSCNNYINAIHYIGNNADLEFVCNHFHLDQMKDRACGGAYDVFVNEGVYFSTLVIPSNFGNLSETWDNKISDFNSGNYSPINIEVLGSSSTPVYYHQSNNYPYEPEIVAGVSNSLGTSQGCPTFSLCYGTEVLVLNDNPAKRETDAEKLRRLSLLIQEINQAFTNMNADVFNSGMKELVVDTGAGHSFSSRYDVYHILRRVVNEGDDPYDINEKELGQLDSILALPPYINNQHSWIRSYLLGYKMHQIEEEERKRQDSTAMSIPSLIDVNDLDVQVYPNPASNKVFIQLGEIENLNLSILDLQGRVVKSGIEITGSGEISLEGLTSGSYLLQLNHKDYNKVIQLNVK